MPRDFEQENTPFAEENYTYINETMAASGAYLSDIIEIDNGTYRLTSDVDVSVALVIYNPLYGCYGCEDDDLVLIVSSDWIADAEKFKYEFTIDVQYQNRYVRVYSNATKSQWGENELKLYKVEETGE